MKSQAERFNDWAIDNSVFMETNTVLHPIDEDGSNMEAALMDCIKRLKDEQGECIRLFYFENRCYREIAIRLNTDEKKVKSYLQNAKRNLKLCLEEKHGEKE
jgi:RNA polymerase sigma-70 factor (ECF subfamily)